MTCTATKSGAPVVQDVTTLHPYAQVNAFLRENKLSIASNPCVSPDFCLDWEGFKQKLLAGSGSTVHEWPKSAFKTAVGEWSLLEDSVSGDHAWKLKPQGGASAIAALNDGAQLADGSVIFPATFQNLLTLKNLVQSFDRASTIFPSAAGNLGTSTLGIGARFTTLHWPAVEWAMSNLGIGVTANQNSIPRELVYDVNAMLAGKLDTVPFPFIGTNVPEGHQGQSVEGMSHGCVLSKLKFGFHQRKIAWSFNADHQPIGGKYDVREDQLVAGCALASYITFDLSPELAQTKAPANPEAWVRSHVPARVIHEMREVFVARGVDVKEAELYPLLATVWPAVEKMKARDDKYAAIRKQFFTEAAGQRYLRELSIDELPGITTPETTAVMLALCETLGMHINFVAPAFGFQKNLPYADNAALEQMIEQQWDICRRFGASIGFHSGSGKSGENYQIMGKVTGGRLEIKTSGRYTYEMGRALFESSHAGDQKLWNDWYDFTVNMAASGAFSADATEQKMARSFITASFAKSGAEVNEQIFSSPDACRAAIQALPRSPENMFWFEYNFLYVLAAEGRAEKGALGDHSPAGYAQRSRFYGISPEARLQYSKNVASYIVFLAENTGLVPEERCRAATKKLTAYGSLDELLNGI